MSVQKEVGDLKVSVDESLGVHVGQSNKELLDQLTGRSFTDGRGVVSPEIGIEITMRDAVSLNYHTQYIFYRKRAHLIEGS